MAKYCSHCGKKLSFFAFDLICKDKESSEIERSKLEAEISKTKNITDNQVESLKKLIKRDALKLYETIYSDFESDAELNEQEIKTLQKIQKRAQLTNEEVKYNERVRPYAYALILKKEGKLPEPELNLEGVGQIIFKKNEVVHFADAAILRELRSIRLGYRGGSHGVSIRIAKGVRYRVGAHKGHIEKEDRYVETSRGFLLVTNQRLFLHPLPGHKPLSIPLNKILSYQCFQNGMEIYKEGREKGYFFSMDSSSVEIFGLCLSHLLNQ